MPDTAVPEPSVVIPKSVRERIARVPINERKRGGLAVEHMPAILSEMAELTLAGWNDAEIAAEFGISTRTLYRWKLQHAEFAKALDFNNKAAVDRVRGAFFAKASGYSYVEQQAIKVKTGEHTEEIQVVDVVKHVVPDTTAGIFFLKNRAREDWTDVQRVELNANVNTDTDIKAVALAMLATIRAGLVEAPAKTIEHEENE
jgi:transposase-like protein